MVSKRFSETPGEDGDQDEDDGYKYHSPSQHHAITTHPEELKCACLADRAETSPEPIGCQD